MNETNENQNPTECQKITDGHLFSASAEQSVVGGLMLDNDAYDLCAELQAAMFYDYRHAEIFDAAKALISQNQPADSITVSEFLDRRGILENCGGLQYVSALALNVPSAANISRYIGIVKDKYALRELFLAGNKITKLALERDGTTIEQKQAIAGQLLEKVSDMAAGPLDYVLSSADAMKLMVDAISTRLDLNDGEMGGLTYGLRGLNEKTDGLHPGNLIVVAARPSMGKSILGENIARANVKLGKKVLVFSAEMPTQDWVRRGLCAEHSVDGGRVFRSPAKMDGNDWDALNRYIADFSSLGFWIDDRTNEMGSIIAKARAHKRRYGLDLIVIDHLHHLRLPGLRSRAEEYGDVTLAAKEMAKELGIPVLLLAQINRDAAKNGGRRPEIADIKWCGDVEQIADDIVMIHRQSYYDNDANPGEAEMIIGKARNGETGVVAVGFRGDYFRFQNTIPTDYNPAPRVYQPDDDFVDCL